MVCTPGKISLQSGYSFSRAALTDESFLAVNEVLTYWFLSCMDLRCVGELVRGVSWPLVDVRSAVGMIRVCFL